MLTTTDMSANDIPQSFKLNISHLSNMLLPKICLTFCAIGCMYSHIYAYVDTVAHEISVLQTTRGDGGLEFQPAAQYGQAGL